eukprot:TRINITY_DN3022_c1_g1_i3.p1 TRINITY_DN3022_c1_g1~~TRINITY_DN3022_c1_g1_i3.p1  ORF type:complete len:259 (-),score=-25.39 TRINITY_DN3022_c1_g1_i3:198-887(-)
MSVVFHQTCKNSMQTHLLKLYPNFNSHKYQPTCAICTKFNMYMSSATTHFIGHTNIIPFKPNETTHSRSTEFKICNLQNIRNINLLFQMHHIYTQQLFLSCTYIMDVHLQIFCNASIYYYQYHGNKNEFYNYLKYFFNQIQAPFELTFPQLSAHGCCQPQKHPLLFFNKVVHINIKVPEQKIKFKSPIIIISSFWQLTARGLLNELQNRVLQSKTVGTYIQTLLQKKNV